MHFGHFLSTSLKENLFMEAKNDIHRLFLLSEYVGKHKIKCLFK